MSSHNKLYVKFILEPWIRASQVPISFSFEVNSKPLGPTRPFVFSAVPTSSNENGSQVAKSTKSKTLAAPLLNMQEDFAVQCIDVEKSLNYASSFWTHQKRKRSPLKTKAL